MLNNTSSHIISEKQSGMDESKDLPLPDQQIASTSSHETPPSDCDIWAGIYLDHGSMLEERFREEGRLEDLENALSDYPKAAELTEPGHDVCKSTVLRKLEAALEVHEKKPAQLRPNDGLHDALGNAFLERFKRFGRQEDLENAIASLRTSFESTPDGHPEKLTFLGRLRHALDVYAKRPAGPEDLEGSISTLRHAVNHLPKDHADMPIVLGRLGHALEARFKVTKNSEDLNSAIPALLKAIELGHPDTRTVLSHLGHALEARFKHLDNSEDLDNLLPALRRAVDLTPDAHQDRLTLLRRLGHALDTRFNRLDLLEDLDSVILTLSSVVELMLDDDPDKPIVLGLRGHALEERFKRLDGIEDLDSAISNLRKAVELTPNDPADKAAAARSCLAHAVDLDRRKGNSTIKIEYEILEKLLRGVDI